MSVALTFNLYIIAKTKEALIDSKTRLLDTAFGEDPMRGWVDELFSEPEFFRNHWFCEASDWLDCRAVADIFNVLDQFATEDYVVYGEVADGSDVLRCPATGLHEDVKWKHFNSDQVYAFLEALDSHQPSQERG